MAFNPGYFTFIFDPSPVILLAACILEGCAISSFTYRRQVRDRFQAPIFVISITAVMTTGLACGINANIQMLAVMPWTLCFAMLGSAMIHWLYRRCAGTTYYRLSVCEVGEKRVIMERWNTATMTKSPWV
jgi:hypothetical protein